MAATATDEQPQPPRTSGFVALREAAPGSRIAAALVVWLAVSAFCTAVWFLTGRDGDWAAWVAVGGGVPVAAAALLRAAWRVRHGPARWAAAHAGLAVTASATLVAVWWLTGAGEWLWWPLLGIALAFTVHAALAFADRLPPRPQERRLSARVTELERTRRDALDLQAMDLRRLERDLHDGAQSRLVALGLLLGRAEARLPEGSDEARLVRQAREEATAAVAELRDLARGLAPPLLAERGVVAAVRGLARRTPVPVRVIADVEDRPPAEVEAAAYFVAAEALTNVLKHAPGSSAAIELSRRDGAFVVRVSDTGPGGADLHAGTGLDGLRRRVEALDGRLDVLPGKRGGTVVRAELPCGS